MAEFNAAREWVIKGSWFQFPMILVWLGRGVYYNTIAGEKWLTASGATATIGIALMAFAMVRIYTFNKRPRHLITSDIFALTRHPMYHGMFIADAASFFTANLSDPVFWGSWILFVILLFGAGWNQEKETLARWGDEAEIYYAKTPRFIFEWLWRWAYV